MSSLRTLKFLHILNDGFYTSALLLLPFIAADLELDFTRVGLLGTAVNMLQIFLAVPAGYFALKLGGLRLLVLGVLLYGLGYFGMAVTSGFFLLIPAFLLAGIGFAIFHPVAFALVSKNSPQAIRGKTMGDFTAIGDIGKIGISAGVTFLIAYIGWRLSALSFAFVSAAIFVFLYRFIPDQKINSSASTHSPKTDLSLFFKNKKFVYSTISGALDTFASNALFVFLPFLLLKRGVDPAILGSFTAAFFVGNFIGKSLLGRLVDKYGGSSIFIISEVLMAVFIVILASSASLIIIIGASIILGFFTKGTAPVIQTMVAESVDADSSYEKTFGINFVIVGIAQTIAPITLGFFSDRIGIVNAFNISALAALLAVIPAYAFKIHSQT